MNTLILWTCFILPINAKPIEPSPTQVISTNEVQLLHRNRVLPEHSLLKRLKERIQANKIHLNK